MSSEKKPISVLHAAKELVERYGERLAFIGEYKTQEVYVFSFPDDVEVGFPFLYLYDKEKRTAIEITGPEAQDIIAAI